MDSELVIETSWFDTLAAEPERIPLWRARAERDGVWAYDREIPINLEIFDESVVIWLGEEHGEELVVRGVLVTQNPAILSWAESLYHEYRAEAEPLDPATLPEA